MRARRKVPRNYLKVAIFTVYITVAVIALIFRDPAFAMACCAMAEVQRLEIK